MLVPRFATPMGPRPRAWGSIGLLDELPADRRDQSHLVVDLVGYKACIHGILARGYAALELCQSRICR
jgi:hypothetical protein